MQWLPDGGFSLLYHIDSRMGQGVKEFVQFAGAKRLPEEKGRPIKNGDRGDSPCVLEELIRKTRALRQVLFKRGSRGEKQEILSQFLAVGYTKKAVTRESGLE